jgi:hypothetical protein
VGTLELTCVPHRNWITKLVHDVVHNVIAKHTHKECRCIFFILKKCLNWRRLKEFFERLWIWDGWWNLFWWRWIFTVLNRR